MKTGLRSIRLLPILIPGVLSLIACKQEPVAAEVPAPASSAPVSSSAPVASSTPEVSSARVGASTGLVPSIPSTAPPRAATPTPKRPSAKGDPDYCKGQLREGCTDPKSGFVARD